MNAEVITKVQRVDKLVGRPQQLKSPRSNLVCICADCQKIRDGQGHWHQSKGDINDDPSLEFTHGFCPDCLVQRHLEVDNYIKMAQSN